MKTVMEECAKQLIEEGRVIKKVSAEEIELTNKVKKGYRDFLERHNTLESRALWQLNRAGEQKPDSGLIRKKGANPTDTNKGRSHEDKWSFHYGFFLRKLLNLNSVALESDDLIFLDNNQALFDHSKMDILELARAVDESHRYPVSLSEPIRQCYENPEPYSAAINRSLHYPSQEQTQRARTHVDRSIITRHMGDKGGYLYMTDSEESNDLHNISPKQDEVLLFWGVKAYVLTKGDIKPMWHGSKAAEGEVRESIIHFCHINTDEVINDPMVAYRKYQEIFAG
ncbi:MAG: hypothetical protein ACI9VM_000468 [Candidatus Azotimanducaceae bacterium]|jgi:hypothetical protein